MKVLVIACALLFAGISPSRAEELIVAFSADHIAIDSNFTGTELTVFGAIERVAESPKRSGPYDVIMIVHGPLGNLTVREKQPVGPFWINRAQREFLQVPSFLSVLSDRPISEMIDTKTQQDLAASVEAQFAAHVAANGRNSDRDFIAALDHIRRAQGLFSDDSDAILFLSSTLFRTTIRLPGAAPLGHYEVDVIGFADGEKIAEVQTGFWVNRSGFEHMLASAARDHGVLYGLAVIAMALAFGWIASVIFRRD